MLLEIPGSLYLNTTSPWVNEFWNRVNSGTQLVRQDSTVQHKLALTALRKSVASKPCPVDRVPWGRFWINGNHLGEMRLVFAEWKPGARRLLASPYKLCCCSVAKSCWTLCDAMASSPPGSSVPGKNTRVGSHFFLQGIYLTRDRSCVSCTSLALQADSLPLSHLKIWV